MSTNSTAVINVRINSKTKLQAVRAIEKMGLDVSSAIKLFLNKVIETGAIPFHIGKMNDPRYIAEVKKEVEWAKKYGKKYTSTSELFADWDKLNA
ncbi:MAG: type II toxin-antitoxin system RelB/DinJ family antitoxin [Candidatus Taylorbacteria bacterium]|nr:type II toxin-antitoxin system RelB/DinJ family antitoxin [Candidatus Taylorbacteria bacterium]